MLQTVAVLLLLWVLGVVSAHTIGGFIHILPVVAVVLILVWMMEGSRTAKPRVRSSK